MVQVAQVKKRIVKKNAEIQAKLYSSVKEMNDEEN